MRHISPTEMISRLGTTPVSRVIFRRPVSGTGVFVEILAKNGEEIMISEQGTPDPIAFSSEDVIAFFRELGLFSEAYGDVILDARQYRPSGFAFMQENPEMSFAELKDREKRAEFFDYSDEKPAPLQQPPLQQSQFPTHPNYANPDPFSSNSSNGYGNDNIFQEGLGQIPEKEQEAPQPRLGEKYLTTINLIRLTSLWVVIELVLILVFPSMPPSMKEVLYICVGSVIILAVSFVLFERTNPNHPSLRIRRYLWLCLIVFNISMVLSYILTGKMF